MNATATQRERGWVAVAKRQGAETRARLAALLATTGYRDAEGYVVVTELAEASGRNYDTVLKHLQADYPHLLKPRAIKMQQGTRAAVLGALASGQYHDGAGIVAVMELADHLNRDPHTIRRHVLALAHEGYQVRLPDRVVKPEDDPDQRPPEIVNAQKVEHATAGAACVAWLRSGHRDDLDAATAAVRRYRERWQGGRVLAGGYRWRLDAAGDLCKFKADLNGVRSTKWA